MRVGFKVLVVDDEELYAQAIGDELGRRDIEFDLAYSCSQAISLVSRQDNRYGAVLLDHRLPDREGMSIIPQIIAFQPQASVIMMTAYHSIPDAVQAIRMGAEDYIVKESNLTPIVDRVLEVGKVLEAAPDSYISQGDDELLGNCSAIKFVKEQLQKISRSEDTTVLLTGETGVGKEVAARTLHSMSRPKDSPFVVVDCIALPASLSESILFGHEKGSFTGADQARAGAFEEASGGTLLLDEIGDMNDLQGKLLRVLESKKFSRVGSVKEISLDARVIAATNRDLKQLVDKGEFRLDLYQRLCVFPISIPPLRQRGEDIILLAEHFKNKVARRLNRNISPLSEQVRDVLMAYEFPGNVRELKNIMERAVIMSDSGRIELKHLPNRVLTREVTRVGPSELSLDFRPGVDTLESLEKRMIQQALVQAKHVKTEAARLLGISRFQLLRRMERHGLNSPASKSSSK